MEAGSGGGGRRNRSRSVSGDGRGKKRRQRKKKSPGPPPERLGEDGAWEKSRQVQQLQLVSELAPKHAKWDYRLMDESRRCFAAFHPSPVNHDCLNNLFHTIKNGTEWLQPKGPLGVIPRKTAWMVAPGCECPYNYGGIEVKAQVFPTWMFEVMRIYMPLCGFAEQSKWPNSCNLNLYENGSQSVGWHADDEALFQGLRNDIRILSLSLGQRRKFRLKKTWPQEGEEPDCHTFMLSSGMLCTMEGMVQKHYQHCVPKEKEDLGPRINLTWRWIVKHHKVCCRR